MLSVGEFGGLLKRQARGVARRPPRATGLDLFHAQVMAHQDSLHTTSSHRKLVALHVLAHDVIPRSTLPPRFQAFLVAFPLVVLQSAAPLLHAHAATDPYSVAVSGLHVPGLEPVLPMLDGRDRVTDRQYPLIEEADSSRRDDPGLVIDQPGHPYPSPSRVSDPQLVQPVAHGGHSRGACAPPPSRAPPHQILV